MPTTEMITLPDNWEAELESLMFLAQPNNKRQKAYIASPCNALSPMRIYQNMRAARFYLYYVHKYLKLNAWAPHAYLPAMLNDNVSRHRQIAMQFGLELLHDSKELHVCGTRLTNGMESEVLRAAYLARPITVYSALMWDQVTAALGSKMLDAGLVSYNHTHPMLALTADELFREEGYYA